VQAEGVPGGFSAVYDVLKALEDAGRVRRGYFVAGLGATQFAMPGADDRLRACREAPPVRRTVVLAATDPANPYGAALGWQPDLAGRPQRGAGAHVVISDGRLLGYVARSETDLLLSLRPDEPERSHDARALAFGLASLVEGGRRRILTIERIDGADANRSPLAPALLAAGFTPVRDGFQKRAG
jgi:ATP-dependent Lhr-like helicase